jgi:hypothetical protein
MRTRKENKKREQEKRTKKENKKRVVIHTWGGVWKDEESILPHLLLPDRHMDL